MCSALQSAPWESARGAALWVRGATVWVVVCSRRVREDLAGALAVPGSSAGHVCG
jgi:hypothetical protein